MKENTIKKTNIIINITAIIVLVAIFIFLFVYFYDEIKLINTKEGLESFLVKLRAHGVLGSVILVLIQLMQVVVVFIPGEFVEIASGIMFGPWLGLILCLIGLNLGTCVIWLLVKLLGRPFVEHNVSHKWSDKLTFLKDENRALIILFFIFLIPGIPKDILIYPVPLTKISLSKFMLVSSVARIPSVVSSTFLGSYILSQNYIPALIIMGVSLILAVVGLVFNKSITNAINNMLDKNKKDSEV